MPKIAKIHLWSDSPYSQSKYIDQKKPAKVSSADWEEEVWDQRMHLVDDEIVIPPMAFKYSLEEAARRSGQKIQGRGNATWTKRFVSGIVIQDPLHTGVRKADVGKQPIFGSSTGEHGKGKRVMKYFPLIMNWEGDLTVTIIDDTITREIFERMLIEAGQLVGVGRFRPETGGFYGRFRSTVTSWEEWTNE